MRLTPSILALTLLLAACGRDPAPIPAALPYTDPGFVSAGEYRLYYALIMTRELPSAIADSYGIVPRRNLALLSITLLPRGADGVRRIPAMELAATAIRLTGEREALALVRHDEAGGPTYLARVAMRHRTPLTIEIRARATAESPPMSARLTREFHFD